MSDAPHRISALEVYQRALDTLSGAILGGDLDLIESRVALPYRRMTLTTEVVVETAEDLRRGWLEYGRNLRAHGVNQYIRLASDAEYLGEGYIEGHHITHALQNGKRVVPTYANRSVLKNCDGVWKLVEIESAVATSWPITSIRAPSHPVDLRGLSDAANDARRTEAEPIVLYQRFLDRLTRTTWDNDLDAFCALCQFPYTSHSDTADTTLTGPDDVRPFFDMLVDLIREHDADTFQRRAERAEFLSGSQICGYHSTEFRRDGQVVVGPIRSRMTLSRRGTDWRMTSVTNTVTNTEFPYRAPQPSQTLVTLRQIQERNRT